MYKLNLADYYNFKIIYLFLFHTLCLYEYSPTNSDRINITLLLLFSMLRLILREREKEFKRIWELETISETNVTFRISNTYTHATSFYFYVAFIGLGLGLVGLLLVVQLIWVLSFRLQIVRVFFFFFGVELHFKIHNLKLLGFYLLKFNNF